MGEEGMDKGAFPLVQDIARRGRAQNSTLQKGR